MTLRHGLSAALLVLAGIGWAVNPPPRLAVRRVQVAATCLTLGVGALAAGVWSGRRVPGKVEQA